MTQMPSPSGWAAFAVVVGMLVAVCTVLFKVLRSPSPAFGEGGYGGTVSEAELQRRSREAAPRGPRLVDPGEKAPELTGPRRQDGPEVRGRSA